MASVTARQDQGGITIGWQVRIRKKGYPVQTRTFRLKAQAPMWARQIENEMDRGAFVPHAEFESTTREEALDRYAREILPQKKKEHRSRTGEAGASESRNGPHEPGGDHVFHRCRVPGCASQSCLNQNTCIVFWPAKAAASITPPTKRQRKRKALLEAGPDVPILDVALDALRAWCM